MDGTEIGGVGRRPTPLQVWLSTHMVPVVVTAVLLVVGLTVVVSVMAAFSPTLALATLSVLGAVAVLGVAGLFLYFRSYLQAIGWLLLCAGIGLATAMGNDLYFFALGFIGIALLVFFRKS